MLIKRNLSAYAYSILLTEKSEDVNLTHKAWKWQEELNQYVDVNLLHTACKSLYNTTNLAKYRSFQYRLIHRAVILNTHLHRWRIKNTNLCTFCNREAETYVHLFVMCPIVKSLWIKTEQFMTDSLPGPEIVFNPKTIIFNQFVDDAKNIKNFVCLLLKQYIYRKRCYSQLPNFYEFKSMVLETRSVEFYIAKKNNQERKHFLKWSPVDQSDQLL